MSYKIYMEENEINAFKNLIKSSDVVFEYGSGGSTLYFSNFVKEYHSLEHDKEWYEKISKQVKDVSNIFLYYIKNNKPRTLPTKPEEFKDYIDYICRFDDNFFDVIFVDGRARVYCAKKSFDKLKKNGILIIHDYNVKGREHYLEVENLYSKFNQVGTLAFFKKKN